MNEYVRQVFQTALQGSEIVTEDSCSQQINSQLSREVVCTYKLICLKHVQFSWHHVSSVACGMFLLSCFEPDWCDENYFTYSVPRLQLVLWGTIRGCQWRFNTRRLCKPIHCALITTNIHPTGISKQCFVSVNSLEYMLEQTDERFKS